MDAHQTSEWWVTPLLWGADTGLIVTTFRVTAASWALLVAAAVGVAPVWTGLVFGLSFGLPLLVALTVGDPDQMGIRKATVTSFSPTRRVQTVSIVAMTAVFVSALSGG